MYAVTINARTSPRSTAIVDFRVSDSRTESGLARAHSLAKYALAYYTHAPLNPRAIIVGIKSARKRSTVRRDQLVSRTRNWSRVS